MDSDILLKDDGSVVISGNQIYATTDGDISLDGNNKVDIMAHVVSMAGWVAGGVGHMGQVFRTESGLSGQKFIVKSYISGDPSSPVSTLELSKEMIVLKVQSGQTTGSISISPGKVEINGVVTVNGRQI